MVRKSYTLIGADGKPYESTIPGTLGGHCRSKGYGRLDCPVALRWIAKGHYVRHRVFFADEATAVAAGYRPCAVCMPERYRAWKGRERPGMAANAGTAGRSAGPRRPAPVRRLVPDPGVVGSPAGDR